MNISKNRQCKNIYTFSYFDAVYSDQVFITLLDSHSLFGHILMCNCLCRKERPQNRFFYSYLRQWISQQGSTIDSDQHSSNRDIRVCSSSFVHKKEVYIIWIKKCFHYYSHFPKNFMSRCNSTYFDGSVVRRSLKCIKFYSCNKNKS